MSHPRQDSAGVAERIQRAGEQFLEWNANAVPGASRYEEGEEHTSPVPSLYSSTHHGQESDNNPSNDTPALRALRRTYSHMEADRERDRYAEYLDDKDSEGMPNAFDLGWRRNLAHLFGPNPLLWGLPICNTTGDGWRWEVSPAWSAAQEEMSRRKERSLAVAENQNQGQAHVSAGYEQSRDREYHYGYDGHDDLNQNEDGNLYSRSAMSMKHLPPPSLSSRSESDRSRRRQRRGFDQAEPFEVSSTDEGSDDEFGRGEEDDVEGGWMWKNRGR